VRGGARILLVSGLLLGLFGASEAWAQDTAPEDPPATEEPAPAPAPWVYDPDRKVAPPPPEDDGGATLSPHSAQARDAAARAKEHRQFAKSRQIAKDIGLGLAIGGSVTFVLGYTGSIVTGLVASARCSEPRSSCRGVTEWVWIPFANAFTAVGISDDKAVSWGTAAGLFTAQLLGAAFGAAGAWMHANPEQFFPSAASLGPDSVSVLWVF
jgi:hypothetical protein